MKIKRQYLPPDEFIKVLDDQKERERRSYFRRFLTSISYTDWDSTQFLPYGPDDVCMKLAMMKLVARDSAFANGPDPEDEIMFPIDEDLYIGFLNAEDKISGLLVKIRDRKMKKEEYNLILEDIHSICKEMNNLISKCLE